MNDWLINHWRIFFFCCSTWTVCGHKFRSWKKIVGRRNISWDRIWLSIVSSVRPCSTICHRSLHLLTQRTLSILCHLLFSECSTTQMPLRYAVAYFTQLLVTTIWASVWICCWKVADSCSDSTFCAVPGRYLALESWYRCKLLDMWMHTFNDFKYSMHNQLLNIWVE